MYALRMLGDMDAAEDVVQSAFESAWVRVDEITALRPYMYRAVYNGCVAWLRERDRMTGLDAGTDVMAAADDEAIDRSERDARLWRAVNGLPPRCREIFLMCKRDGMSYAAIAEELGLSVKTVDAQVAKALRVLRGVGSEVDLRNFSVLFVFL